MLEQFAAPFVQIAITPIVIKTLGAAEFGVWTLLTSIIAVGQIVSFGAGVATVRYVSFDLSAAGPEAAARTVRSAVALVVMGGGALLGATILGAHAIAAIFLAKMGDPESLARYIAVAAMIMILQEVDNVYASALRGAQRYDVSAKVEIATRFVLGCAVAICVLHFRTVNAMLFCVLFMTAAKVCVKAIFVSRFFLHQCLVPNFEAKAIARILEFGKWQWIQGMSGLLLSVADRFIVGAVFGAATLGVYGACLQLAQYVHGMPAAALQVIFPWISSRKAEGRPIAGRTLRRFALGGGVALFASGVCLAIISKPVLTMWISSSFASANYRLFVALVVAYSVLAAAIPTHFIMLGLGQVKFVSLANVIAAAVSTGVAIAVIPLGIVAFASAKVLYGLSLFVVLLQLFALLRKEHNRTMPR